MSNLRKRVKKDERRRTYTVRFNVGDLYIQPPKNIKHWTMSIDERGGYWTRIIKENNRNDAVYWTLRWFSNLIYRIKKRPNSVFHALPIKFADACIEVSDDYDEVVFTRMMKPSLPINRLLPHDKLEEIIELSKGLFKKTTDFTKKGCFTQTKEYKNKAKREFYEKVPNVPYLYINTKNKKYMAKVKIQSQVMEGGVHRYIGCERNGAETGAKAGSWKRVYWEHTKGEIVQQRKNKWFRLKSHNVVKAAAEARAIAEEYEKRKSGFYTK